MRKVLGYLSEEDLELYRRSYARTQVALAGHSGLSVDEAADIIVEDTKLFKELRDRYDIDPEEAVDFSVFDGAILDDAMEG